LNIIAYIIVNILLFASWYVFLFRQKELLSFVDRTISTFILGLTQIIATEMLLGVVLKKLYAAQLFWINVSVSLVVLSCSISTGKTIIFPSPLFSKWGGEKISRGQLVLKDILTEISGKAAWFWTVIKSDLILFFIFMLFFMSVCWIIFSGYLFPSYTWDALWYHLPIAGYIMQSGAIQEIPNNSFIEQFINIFPKNIELFFIWNIIFLKNDIITDLSQLLFTIAGVLAIYSIAVKLNIKERAAIYSSLLFFFTPIVILQSTTNYVDVAVSVLFLVALNFLMDDMPCKDGFETRPYEGDAGGTCFQKRNITTVMAGLTAGILLGSKGSGPLFIALLSAVVIIREFPGRSNACESGLLRWKKMATKTFQLYFFYFFIPVLFMGGYWYIKNWIIYGNPVYPMEISILNNTIFKGLYQGIIEPAPEIINKLHPFTRPLYVWLDKVEYYLYDSRLGGFGPIWFILFLPSIVLSFVYALMKRRYRFILLLIIVASAFLMYPRNWNPRYVIFIIGLGALSFGLVFDKFQKRNDIFRVIAILLAGYTFLISNSPCVTPKQIKKFIQLPAAERIIAAHAPFNIDLYARQDYGYWTWINRNISQGETLAYTYEPLFLSPMWNSAFSNKMVYIKADDYKQWLRKLGEHKVTYVLIRKNSGEDRWIQGGGNISSSGQSDQPGVKFKTLFSDENYKIAQVIESEV
jgi:hypothetical protein